MKPLIRIFTGSNAQTVENEVNEWLMSLDKNHNKVIDIKFSTTVETFDIMVYIETGV